MNAFLKKIGSELVICLILTSVISMGSLWLLRKSTFYKPSFLVNGVKDVNFDYIVLGASTGLTTLDTKHIDTTLHLVGLNLSMDDTGIPSQYLMLQHFLAEGKTTKYCIIAPGVSGYNSKNEKLSDNDYRFLMFNNKRYVNDYYSNFKGTEARILSASQYLSFIGVSYYNAELFYPSLLNLINPNKRNRFDEKGNYTYPVTRHANDSIEETRDLNVTFQSPYLTKIKELCEENDIRLICYISPMEDKNAIVNSSEYECINHSRIINNKKYFYDKDHVNSTGRTLSSDAFSNAFRDLIARDQSLNLK